MFGLGPATKIYIAVEAVDMRKGFDGLYGPVRDRLGEDPLSGHLFLFANRARSRLKVLVWDGSGLWGLREAAGEGPVSLAGFTGRTVQGDAAGRAGNAGERLGRGGCTAAQLAEAGASGIKDFFAFVSKRLAITRCLTYKVAEHLRPSNAAP